jgi:ABC-type lipopolysaccharide export system ATPase subunit
MYGELGVVTMSIESWSDAIIGHGRIEVCRGVSFTVEDGKLVALARRPSVLLLDEPSQGLAPLILEQLVQVIGALRALRASVVLAEQNHQFAARLADRYLVLQGGEIVGGGSGDELNDRERAAAALMGI